MKRALTTTIAYLATFLIAFAQQAPPPAEVTGEPISWLMFFTLGTALAVGVGGLFWFLRSRSNRAAADRALNPNNPKNQ